MSSGPGCSTTRTGLRRGELRTTYCTPRSVFDSLFLQLTGPPKTVRMARVTSVLELVMIVTPFVWLFSSTPYSEVRRLSLDRGLFRTCCSSSIEITLATVPCNQKRCHVSRVYSEPQLSIQHPKVLIEQAGRSFRCCMHYVLGLFRVTTGGIIRIQGCFLMDDRQLEAFNLTTNPEGSHFHSPIVRVSHHM